MVLAISIVLDNLSDSCCCNCQYGSRDQGGCPSQGVKLGIVQNSSAPPLPPTKKTETPSQDTSHFVYFVK